MGAYMPPPPRPLRIWIAVYLALGVTGAGAFLTILAACVAAICGD